MNYKRASLIPFAVLAGIAIAAPVAAHNATATPSCGGLTWQASTYDKTVVNTITVTVDGTVVWSDPDFKSSDSGSASWSQTASHSWSVVIDAPSTQFDRSFGGTWQACQASTSTTVVATTTVPLTTSVPDVATTVVTDTTTTQVAVCCPPVPSTALGVSDPVLVPEPRLPETGLSAGDIASIALFAILGGGVLLWTRRLP